MKILQVAHYFTLYGMGGSEVYTYSLANALSREHDVRLFFTMPDDGGTEKILEGNYKGIPYWALKKNPEIYDKPFHEYSRWVEEAFAKVINEFKPDVIHFQHLVNLSLTLPLLAKKASIPCCFTLHDFWLLCPRTNFLNLEMELCNSFSLAQCVDCTRNQIGYYPLFSEGLLPVRLVKRNVKRLVNLKKRITAYLSLGLWRAYWVRKIFKAVDVFIAPSQFLQKRFIMHGLSPQKILFIRHGFEKKMFEGIKKTSSPILRFAFIGTMRVHKGIHILIDAFNRITGPHELKMYGRISPAVKEELSKKIKNPHIQIMGELKEDDKQRAFSDMDVLILPSICYENCPIVINEAFIAKIPIITSNIGGMAELVSDSEGGLTFPVGDAEMLAVKIQMFIDDPQIGDLLSIKIPEVKSIEDHANEISRIYSSLNSPIKKRI
jgi:glycosyltransferase involved in cell wall biosynthesis